MRKLLLVSLAMFSATAFAGPECTTGWNSDKKKVEIYFDPVTGNPVKEEIED
jgi:hypothetical protein